MYNKMLKLAVLFICATVISASAVPTVYALSANAITFGSPIEIAQGCSSDPNAPCYVVPFQRITPMIVPNASQQIACGVNIQNAFHQNVAQLWTNVNVTWDNPFPYDYDYNVTGLSYGTWVLNGAYGWTNLVGPTGYGEHTGYHAYGQTPDYFTSTGTVLYLGLPFGNYTATVVITGKQSFYCRSY